MPFFAERLGFATDKQAEHTEKCCLTIVGSLASIGSS
jgi:hypothetical protein